jgi:hypothetical protein
VRPVHYHHPLLLAQRRRATLRRLRWRARTTPTRKEMARRIDASWDRTLELTLEENGIRV